MLSETQVVKVRKAIESTYDGKVTVTEHQKVVKANKSTGFEDVVVLENQSCRLSFKSVTKTVTTESAATVEQTIKVFVAPEITIKPGSKLTITQYGVTTEYKNSGVPATYPTHQEIVLELFRGWA